MREIKFRGKHQDTGEWVYGDLCISAVHEPNICWADEDLVVIDTPVIRPDTIGQYTGLKDGQGKEIYEGDILGFIEYEDALPETVIFVEGCFVVTDCHCTIEMDAIDTKCRTIIGNIHDNPELIDKTTLTKPNEDGKEM